MTERFSTYNNILISDEALFDLNSLANKQICRYWSATNLQNKHQRGLHAPKGNPWAATLVRGILGRTFEDGRRHTVTINSERYVEMLDDFLVSEL